MDWSGWDELKELRDAPCICAVVFASELARACDTA